KPAHLAGRQGARAPLRVQLLAPYALAALLGAALLFLIEPMAAKALLPVLGGSAGVWSVSLVFYQALLFLAYGYAHAVTGRLSLRRGALVHAAVIGIAALRLPFGGLTITAGSASPTWGVIVALVSSIGAPFFALAATGPLLQRWLAAATGRDAY